MYCKVLKKRPSNTVVENSLQCCCIYPLRKSKVTEMFSANFKLSCQGEGIIFHAENDLQCREWVAQIKEVIDMLVESRKTLRKESSRKRPVKKNQLKYFEAEYILSPPQKGIKYDYENVYKYTDLSSIEQPSSSRKVKKGSKKIPKIKISRSKEESPKRSRTPEMRNSSTPTKKFSAQQYRPQSLPATIPSHTRFARIKSWFSFRSASHSNNSKESVSDPTYGFGSRCTNQTYFKTANVDSSIPNDVDFKIALAGMLGGDHSIDSVPSTINATNNTNNMTTPDAKDILYPLRTSLDRVSSGKKRKQVSDDDNSTDYLTNQSTKRVKFDDKEDVASESFFERRERLHAQQYQQENYVTTFKPQTNHVSLKDRIVDFFTKLI